MPRTPSPDDEPIEAARAEALSRLLADADTVENELNDRSPESAKDFAAVMSSFARFIEPDAPAADDGDDGAAPLEEPQADTIEQNDSTQH